ncbi:MAG TPA: SAM-dependent methyltransferase [Bacteroidetes bacterium]|nr:SAM-dependent methyltransferase [Bacteroidota bacterium]
MNSYKNVEVLGQVFTPEYIVAEMLQLRKNYGNVLEPSAGEGAFSSKIDNCTSIEIDAKYAPLNTLNIDFFDYPVTNKFDTVIGNPPYVKFKDIQKSTKNKLKSIIFDERSNLYLFFIEKCIKHLKNNGELIFITPRDFLKATSSIKLNEFLFKNGTITDLIELGDKKIFNGYSPNCIIWRFEKNNFSRKTNITKQFILNNGQLLFTKEIYPIEFNKLFMVKVGAVSGNDKIFSSEKYGNEEFVYSATNRTGQTKKMIFNVKNKYLEKYKEELINRKIKKFDDFNWWKWGRLHYISNKKRIYVNCKTRVKNPFFIHKCKNFDGSVLAIFPLNQKLDIISLCNNLNSVDWFELGFVCDGRYIFSQKSLENTMLPVFFNKFAIENSMLDFSP